MVSTNPPFWLGGVAAAAVACCTHPLDLAKVRMQTVASVAAASHPSLWNILRHSIADSGLGSLYVGLSASILRQMSYSMVRLGTYEDIKRRIVKDGPADTWKLMLAAALSGGLGGVAGNPADIVLVRMTTDRLRAPEAKFGYRNALSGVAALVKDEGMKGLRRGLGANTARAILMNCSQVGSYDYFKNILLAHKIPYFGYQFKENFALHCSASCLAGTVATTICAPADVIKSRLMAMNSGGSVFNMLVRSMKEEGPMFLFKGWTPAFLRLAPNTVLLFVLLEQVKIQWKKWRIRRSQ